MCPDCLEILTRYDAVTLRLSNLRIAVRSHYGTPGYADMIEMASDASDECEAIRDELTRHRADAHHGEMPRF